MTRVNPIMHDQEIAQRSQLGSMMYNKLSSLCSHLPFLPDQIELGLLLDEKLCELYVIQHRSDMQGCISAHHTDYEEHWQVHQHTPQTGIDRRINAHSKQH